MRLSPMGSIMWWSRPGSSHVSWTSRGSTTQVFFHTRALSPARPRLAAGSPLSAWGASATMSPSCSVTPRDSEDGIAAFFDEWGVDPTISTPGGLSTPARQTAGARNHDVPTAYDEAGERLGVSTGWILRLRLKRWNVQMVTGVHYRKIDDKGLHYSVDGKEFVHPVDNVIICAGQEPDSTLSDQLRAHKIETSVIGGARFAAELDAMRAIDEATRLAYAL